MAQHSNLGQLIKKLLLSVDSYNSTDLTIETPSNTTVDGLGERARLCINFALHECYKLVKDSRYLESPGPQTISSVANQDYIDLDSITELDDIESITEATNKLKLTRKSWNWYRRMVPDPSNATGVPGFYIRRNNRVYLTPRPTSAISYIFDFRKFTDDLSDEGQFSLLPSKYDGWIIAEAKVKWSEMEDPSAVPALYIEERNDVRQNSIDDILTSYDRVIQSGSHTEPEGSIGLPYASPAE